MHDPANVKKTIEYDPETGNYNVTEKVGDHNFTNPTYMTFDEYQNLVSPAGREGASSQRFIQ